MGGYASKIVGFTPDAESLESETVLEKLMYDHNNLTIPITIAESAGECPEYATSGAAGIDLKAIDDANLYYGLPVLVDTGVSMALPFMLFGQVHGRSGLAAKHNIHVHPGVIDSDFRGTIKIIMTCWDQPRNAGRPSYKVKKGDRIAQLLILPLSRPAFVITDSLTETARGEGGFGSTGRGTDDIPVAEVAHVEEGSAGSNSV